MSTLIFGAQSIALGIYEAVRLSEPETQIDGFLVTSLSGNPARLADAPVYELTAYTASLGNEEKKTTRILIATPEDMQDEIDAALRRAGFSDIVRLDSLTVARRMRDYYERIGAFPLLDALPVDEAARLPQTEIYMASHEKDRSLSAAFQKPRFMHSLQAGAALTDKRTCEYADDVGKTISDKNPDYCELTALYWIWKNRVLPALQTNLTEERYYGLAHYRRYLLLDETDLRRLSNRRTDVVLPYPMICEPDIETHHRRYISERDWLLLLGAIEELYPEDSAAYREILRGRYMYNYSLMLARPSVFDAYCRWLFSILFRVEELSAISDGDHGNRYTAYMGEELVSLYFMSRKDRLRIAHTGMRFLR